MSKKPSFKEIAEMFDEASRKRSKKSDDQFLSLIPFYDMMRPDPYMGKYPYSSIIGKFINPKTGKPVEE